jgi:transposase
MRQYPGPAVERAMKIQEVMLRAMSGEMHWFQAAEILGISPRQMHRWKRRYEEFGYDGLFSRRWGRVSPKRVPWATVETVLRLYRERYFDFNVRHFHEVLQAEHQIVLSYSWVKTALQTAGLVTKSRKRGPHRQRRERRPLPGMLLHIDASKHAWLPGPGHTLQDLLTVSDDATNELYYAALVDEESTATVMVALENVVRTRGVFCALYTDRASHVVWTPKAGDAFDHHRKTQVGRALQQLGIELIAAYTPQARGRKERLYGTLQGRWPQELRLRALTTAEAANAWLRDEGIAAFNARFTVAAAQPGSAFVPAPAGLERIFSIQHERVVGHDNTVRFGRQALQLGPTPLRWNFVKCRVIVHEHLDRTLSVTYGPHTIARFTREGHPIGLVEEKVGTQRSNDAPGGSTNDNRRAGQALLSPSSTGKSGHAAA